MIELSFHGGLGTVGASAVLVDTGVEKIVLDYGTRVREIPPTFPIPLPSKPDTILLTHCHLDHSGGIPLFASNNIPIYAIECTKPLTKLLLKDSLKISHEEGISLPFNLQDVKTSLQNFIEIEYRKSFKLRETEVTFFDAGHIPGSAQVFLRFKNKKSLLYTGDINTINTRLIKRADLNLPEINYLITETTYADRNHPDRKSQEKELIRIIDRTLSNDGVVLLASFAVARAQEILLVLNKYGIDYPLYMDGMAKKATNIINQHRNLLKDPDSLDDALKKVEYVASSRRRKKIIKHPSVIITTSGMLSGGPIIQYLKWLCNDKKSSLVLTGWQLEGTPGRILLETGKYINQEEKIEFDVKMLVRRLDFSAHAGRDELIRFIKKVNPEKVFCVHGDHTFEFSEELKTMGFDAVAPLANNRIFKLE